MKSTNKQLTIWRDPNFPGTAGLPKWWLGLYMGGRGLRDPSDFTLRENLIVILMTM
jgi:hypothetical protein